MGNNLNMKYIVYVTTNKINHKIYIGVHQTETPYKFDGYLGCGAFINMPSSYNKNKTHLHNAILKYGVSAFYRITLKVFDTEEEALELEKQLVTEEFVKRPDTYNCTLGGGMPPVLNKIVYQFDLDGNLIRTWNSIKDATSKYEVNKDRITMTIKDHRSFDNCYWSFESKINVSEYRLSARGYVFQYNKDGILLNSFDNATIASQKLDIARDAIINAVFSRTTCCGYYFLRADEDINKLLNEKSAKLLINTTKVYRYLPDGTFNKEYKSIREAVKDTPKTCHGNIIRAIKHNRTCAGYKWSYTKSETLQPFNSVDLKPVKVAQYDLNHNLIKIWDTVTACKKEFPCCQKVCRKQQKQTKGYVFEYIS